MMSGSDKNERLLADEVQDHVIRAKLRDSKRRVATVFLIDTVVFPLLFGIIVLALWTELNYPQISSLGSLCYLFKHIDETFLMSCFLIWTTSHFLELLFLLGITMDNIRYCRLFVSALAPLLRTMILLSFVLLMWSCMKPLENDNLSRFIIIVGSTIVLLANFFNYYVKALSEHVQLLTLFGMTQKYTVFY